MTTSNGKVRCNALCVKFRKILRLFIVNHFLLNWNKSIVLLFPSACCCHRAGRRSGAPDISNAVPSRTQQPATGGETLREPFVWVSRRSPLNELAVYWCSVDGRRAAQRAPNQTGTGRRLRSAVHYVAGRLNGTFRRSIRFQFQLSTHCLWYYVV